MSKLCPNIILEGTRLTHKDDLTLFVQEKELLQKLVAESVLPTLVLDISDDDIPAAADKIADWMEETGGLWAK
ncbi:MAG: hypothetical protein ISR58_01080 [Anaerolineales bacterium]|nr:hypothetical protein [Chloroflexota bacterium]MBL6979757.1 hypothetical protein [Anaerolineales bacterium]